MAAGRIETYIHSDNITPNKGGVLVKVSCQTDFAAKTDEFISFAKRIAKLAYAFGQGLEWDESTSWGELVKAVGYTGEQGQTLETDRVGLSKLLRETVTIEEIVILTL